MQSGLRFREQIARTSHTLVRTAFFLLLAACYRPATEARPHGSWAYDVLAPANGARVVHVEATFEGAHTERLALPKDAAPFARNMTARVDTDGSFRTVDRKENGEWSARACAIGTCTVRYDVDLGELAKACGDEVDCARRVGDATLSPALSWLVHPMPRNDVPVTVRVHAPDASQFASGMSAVDDTNQSFAFRSFDLDEGSFTAFGPMRRTRIDLAGKGGGEHASAARLDVVVLGTARYAMSDASLKSWVEEAANVTVPLFGRFPVDRATLFVVPAKGEDEVVFGKVLSLAGASVVLVVGDKMQEDARHKDWVLVHELFHLGFPTFRGEGRWLGEGLATYYEPILRARAGWTSDTDVFRQFARNMPRGQPTHGSALSPIAKNSNPAANSSGGGATGLAHRDDLDTIYWGGALFCLAADVRIREETHGKKSLDDVLRALVQHGGDATRVWTVKDVLHLGDVATGTTVLTDMHERYATRSERIDLDGLFGSLGVARDGRDVDDSRPLAWVRRGIIDTSVTSGSPPTRDTYANASHPTLR